MVCEMNEGKGTGTLPGLGVDRPLGEPVMCAGEVTRPFLSSILSSMMMIYLILLLIGLSPSMVQAQTTLKVPFDQASFSWTVSPSGPTNSPADKHTIVCGTISVDVPMPATSKPVREVVPGVGTYNCSLYASNSFGRQVEPNVPFPTFEAGLVPLAPTNPRLEVLP